uniref:Uncharacterized protein n=1 Tax=Arundo donax TaxID=35708 RepID=A0A0A9CHT8_ARUDO
MHLTNYFCSHVCFAPCASVLHYLDMDMTIVLEILMA